MSWKRRRCTRWRRSRSARSSVATTCWRRSFANSRFISRTGSRISSRRRSRSTHRCFVEPNSTSSYNVPALAAQSSNRYYSFILVVVAVAAAAGFAGLRCFRFRCVSCFKCGAVRLMPEWLVSSLLQVHYSIRFVSFRFVLISYEKGLNRVGITDPLIIEQSFSAFDEDKSGSIDFREFVAGMAILNRGSAEDRLRVRWWWLIGWLFLIVLIDWSVVV